MEARTYIVPVVQLASQVAPWAFVAGLMLNMNALTWIGVILFGSSFFFALLTLPVEFDASSRAKKLLVNHGIIGEDQIEGVDKVLDAAAWTYVAAAVSAVGVWLFYVLMMLGRGRSASASSR
jgi:Zn-dependent membrane protease YugP